MITFFDGENDTPRTDDMPDGEDMPSMPKDPMDEPMKEGNPPM